MKATIPKMLAGLFLAASLAQAEEFLPVLKANGRVYVNVTVTSVTKTDISFFSASGVGNAKLKSLDPDLQQHFHYSPPVAGAAINGPVTNTPVTNSPTTNKPVVNGPATNKPATSMLIIISPATHRQVTGAPVTNKPTTSELATNKPRANEPLTKAPMTNGPVTNKPATSKLIAISPANNRQVTNSPVINRLTTSESATNKPRANEPLTKAPTTNGPVTNKPAIIKPVTNVPVAIRQTKAEAKQPQTLADARQGFVTKLIRHVSSVEPPTRPPAGVLDLVAYHSQIGYMAAYISPSPKDGKRHPAIIWLAGGFDHSIDDTFWTAFPPANDQSGSAFRKARIVMMYPALRGGNKNPGWNEGFYGEVDDVLSAVAFLKKQDYVDPDRIYLGGHSTGGTLALLVAESATNSLRAVFAFGPVSDISDYGADRLPFNVKDPQEVALRSPGKWLPSIHVPTFVFEGAEEPSNIDDLRQLAWTSKNPLIKFCPVEGASHFSILAPESRLIAAKILADTNPALNISFTEQELKEAFKK
jgi:hypothetical protein